MPAWRLSVGIFRKLLFTASSKSFYSLGMFRFSDLLDKNLLFLIEKVNKNQEISFPLLAVSFSNRRSFQPSFIFRLFFLSWLAVISTGGICSRR